MGVTITVKSVSLNVDSNIPCLVPSLQYGTPPWAKRLDRRLCGQSWLGDTVTQGLLEMPVLFGGPKVFPAAH